MPGHIEVSSGPLSIMRLDLQLVRVLPLVYSTRSKNLLTVSAAATLNTAIGTVAAAFPAMSAAAKVTSDTYGKMTDVVSSTSTPSRFSVRVANVSARATRVGYLDE